MNIIPALKNIIALTIYSGFFFTLWAFFQRYYVVNIKLLTSDNDTQEKLLLLFPIIVAFVASIIVFMIFFMRYGESPTKYFYMITNYRWQILYSAIFLAISYALYPLIVLDNLINAAFITIAILFFMFLFSFIFSIEEYDGNLHLLVNIKDMTFNYYKDGTCFTIDSGSLFLIKYGYKLMGAAIIVFGLFIYNHVPVSNTSLPEKKCTNLSAK